ncbi:cation diffusion facilitator family transporter [Corynebacterium macginleyi]|uniref:Cation transporter n=2 Tax=Corynebacterium macginleyi TaxID=38290 RepID=A0A3M0GAM9_9CORY|nr:cation diffusion facilitator family transporter [Corynebacterium macginleyi]MBK4140269.1 cation diffusion facilitator family transporter [Corynebacterium macginleyi]MBK4144728.1 cation diffusion facilitator family transporter [Corynebacterium macginleyi]MBK4150973.1 cation diffusion facilitator family transporter [Corynebacterium macginleyi]MBK4152796.1 cation diffusion facilitator family transporter [Corynebacterium macginleyi]
MSSIKYEQRILERFMMLSMAAAVVTIVLKSLAAWLTGSAGFFSDAIESLVNLVAAIAGYCALRISAKPADHNHHFGHGKAEYISALVEGAMIFLAAGAIIYTAIQRLFTPQPVEQGSWGLILSLLSALLNLAVGLALIKAGKRYRSATLTADGHHLITDVWTSSGVLVGMAAVYLTRWLWLDALVALAVGINILWTGFQILRESVSSLLSEALPPEEQDQIWNLLAELETEKSVTFTDRRTVAWGRQRMVYLTMEVPADWSVLYSHEIADDVEVALDELFAGCSVFIHVEPAGVEHRRPLPFRQ